MGLWRLCFVVPVFALAASLSAQAQTTVQQGTYTHPKRAECGRDLPSYPLRERDNWTEGWVDLRFDVTAEGKARDVSVDYQMGRGDFAKHTAKWLEGCQFEPAKRDGTPVEARNQYQRFYFRIESANPGASPEIIRRLRAVDALLEQGKADEAMAELDTASKDSRFLYEMVHIMARRAQAMAVAGKVDLAILYLQQVRYSDSFLGPREQGWVRRLTLRLALSQGLYHDAVDAAETIKNLGEKDADKPLTSALERLRKAVEDGTPFGVDGRIPSECRPEICSAEQPSWRYRPVRRTISLTDIKGELDRVEARCDARTFSAKAEPDVTWTIPASWGECSVSIFGTPGSTFRIIDENV
ncbi:MAG: energy transducer TonB [Niveispirillum sp.]|nr:energy transducer TonB [Niveispirillum sp.]